MIPVFALGRAQELCILIDSYPTAIKGIKYNLIYDIILFDEFYRYWEQMGLNVPIYFAAGLTEKANLYYKLFINWTNQKIKKTFVQRSIPLFI